MRRLTLILLFMICATAIGEEPSADATENADAAKEEVTAKVETPSADDIAEMHAAFGSLMKKSALVGTFTIDGDDKGKEIAERYEISKIVKQSQGDYWNFFARIKYGKHDVTLPIPVEVKWAAKTPVITVDNLTIPGMGTFDARVLISDNKYAGTWRHGKVGGLMYGKIEKQEAAEEEKEPSN